MNIVFFDALHRTIEKAKRTIIECDDHLHSRRTHQSLLLIACLAHSLIRRFLCCSL